MKYSDFSHNISKIRSHVVVGDEVEQAYKTLYDYISDKDYKGACHEMSAAFYVLLTELGVESILCSGELTDGNTRFDHSWVEIKNKIYDITLQHTQVDQRNPPPIFADICVATLNKPKWKYYPPSEAPDHGYMASHGQPFIDYMSNNPNHKNGTFGLIQKLGKKCGLKISLNQMKAKHASTNWHEITKAR